MKNYVRFEIVGKKALNDYLIKGWQIILYNEHEKNYEIGLPIEKAYEQTRSLAQKFLTANLLEELLIRTSKKYGKDFSDYDFVSKYTIKNYCQSSHGTHYIDWDDELNAELNEIVRLLPIKDPQLFAKPIKKE